MKASIVDLRYKMKEVLQALEMNEPVEVLYHGKVKGIIHPVEKNKKSRPKVEDLPFFGMWKDQEEPVEDFMKRIRRGRYHDI